MVDAGIIRANHAGLGAAPCATKTAHGIKGGGFRMVRRVCLLSMGLLIAFSGPCLPNNFFSSVLASSAVSVISALLSDILNTLFPPV
jgi:hypothetical protein